MKVSILDYKRPKIFNVWKSEEYWLDHSDDKHDIIQSLWDTLTWAKPTTKKLFGKEFKLGLKYYLEKQQQEWERSVQHVQLERLKSLLFKSESLRYINSRMPRFNEEHKHAKQKKWIPFYNDIKLLEAVNDFDFDRSFDPDTGETRFHPAIHAELKQRLSKLKFWKTLGGDITNI